MLKLNIKVCLVVMFCKNYDQLFLEVLKSILQSNISSRKYVGFKNIIFLGNVVKCNKSIYVYIVVNQMRYVEYILIVSVIKRCLLLLYK